MFFIYAHAFKLPAILARYSRNREETRVYMNILKALAEQRKKAAQKKRSLK